MRRFYFSELMAQSNIALPNGPFPPCHGNCNRGESAMTSGFISGYARRFRRFGLFFFAAAFFRGFLPDASVGAGTGFSSNSEGGSFPTIS